MRQNLRQKCGKNTGKNPTNEQSERQHFTKHARFCFARFRYSRIFLVFFQFCRNFVGNKCSKSAKQTQRTKKNQKNAQMSAKYTILHICYLSKTHFVRDILQKWQVEVAKTKHSCKTSVIETGTWMTQRDLYMAMAAHVIQSR